MRIIEEIGRRIDGARRNIESAKERYPLSGGAFGERPGDTRIDFINVTDALRQRGEPFV
ncbi:hypothetical protein D3C72_595250 [compost metagenome]